MIAVRTPPSGNRGPVAREDRWPLLLAGLLGAAVAAALASRHAVIAVLAAGVPLAVVAAAGGLARLSRVPLRGRVVGIICVLLVSSTFVWRTRTTQALDTNPLDAAALVRVSLVAAAALLAFVFLLSSAFVPRRIPTPLRFLGAYIVVAALAGLGSPRPLQALYRAFELGAGFLALLVALVLLGERVGPVIVRFLMATVGVIVAVVWIEAFAFPSRAWVPIGSVVPYQLQGFVPAYSSNAVGTFGALLAIWGLAQPAGARHRHLADLTLVLGVVTLLAAQYRTGIIGFLLAGGLVAWHRRRRLFVVLVASTALVVLFAGASQIRAETQTAFAKGRPELIATLNSRTLYWHAAAPAIRERPILGWGLNVGSRRVLVSLGDESTSTIHGTWVEALLGTGVLGATLLAAAFVGGLRRAWRARRDPGGIAIVGMIVFLLVRSITGTTAELFSISFLIFAALAFAAAQLGAPPRRAGWSQ